MGYKKMTELIKTLLVNQTNKFELYGETQTSKKVIHVIWTKLLNPEKEKGHGKWLDQGHVDIDRFIKIGNSPSEILSGTPDNDEANISKFCIELANKNK